MIRWLAIALRWVGRTSREGWSIYDGYKEAEQEARIRLLAKAQDPDASPNRSTWEVEKRIKQLWADEMKSRIKEARRT